MKNKHWFILNGVARCVDSDTEFFNGCKWKKISDYSAGDKVLQYNENGTAELVYPIEYHKNIEDTLYLFKNTRLNMCLSENHNVYYITSKNHLYHKTWKEVIDSYNASKNGFKGKFITTFKYSGTGINLSDNEIRLMVAIFADGTFCNGKKIKIRLKNKSKIERLHMLLKLCNIEYSIKNFNCEKDYTTFYFNPPILEKHFSDYWYNATEKQFKIICDEVILWDGNSKDTFYTSNKYEADFIQFVFSVCGYRGSIYTQNRIGKEKNDRYKYKSLEYTVKMSNDIFPTMDNKHSKNYIVPYKTNDGYSYCFTVPSGMLVLRRCDKIFITGNSGKDSVKLAMNKVVPTFSISTVDKVKEACRILGWNGVKDDAGRLALSDFKDLSTKHFDHPYNYVKNELKWFLKEDNPFMIFTVDLREPSDIKRFSEEFGFETILVVRDSITDIPNNHADREVGNYDYDYVIYNNGTLEDLDITVKAFIDSLD